MFFGWHKVKPHNSRKRRALPVLTCLQRQKKHRIGLCQPYFNHLIYLKMSHLSSIILHVTEKGSKNLCVCELHLVFCNKWFTVIVTVLLDIYICLLYLFFSCLCSAQQQQQQQLKNKFMKKLPRDAEASNVLVGEVDFLETPFVAFVRLQQAVMLGALTEVPVPTR